MIKKWLFILYYFTVFIFIYFLSINKYEWMLGEGECTTMRCLPAQDGKDIFAALSLIFLLLPFLFRKSVRLSINVAIFILLGIYWLWRFYIRYYF